MDHITEQMKEERETEKEEGRERGCAHERERERGREGKQEGDCERGRDWKLPFSSDRDQQIYHSAAIVFSKSIIQPR
jgi:hypothetical protein